MGRYATEAERYFGRIQYFYQNAGATGYSQAKPYYDKLSDLMRRANSLKDKNDILFIQTIIRDVEPLIEEMKERENEFIKPNQ